MNGKIPSNMTLLGFKESFVYDPISGILLRKINEFEKTKYKRMKSSVARKGYLYIKYKNISYTGTRIIWFLFYGNYPEKHMYVDHIDGNTFNNKIYNLRLVTHSGNGRNRVEHRKGSHFGVTKRKFTSLRKWEVSLPRIVNNIRHGKNRYVGIYKTKREAIAALQNAMMLMGEKI